MKAQPQVDLERRRITALTALALLGGATITLANCGGGGGASPAAPSVPPPPAAGSNCPSDAACAQISRDPAHVAVISGAQLAAGGALDLEIQGSSPHSHTVSLTAPEVVAIRERRRVEKVSSTTNNHEHTVTFN